MSKELGRKMLELEQKYSAFVKGKGKIINDPVTIARNTIKNMRQEPLSPRNFRYIEFHSNF